MIDPFRIEATAVMVLLISALSCESASHENASLGKTKEEIQRSLDGRIHKNASPNDVLTVLDQIEIEHSEYLVSANSLDPRLVEELDRSNAGGPTYINTRRIEAILRNVKKSFFISESIQIIFVFDKHDKLVKYELRGIFTGP